MHQIIWYAQQIDTCQLILLQKAYAKKLFLTNGSALELPDIKVVLWLIFKLHLNGIRNLLSNMT